MKSKSTLLSGLLILVCFGLSFAQSGFLKIGDIKGESTHRGHKDWIVIESVSQGLEQQQMATGTTRRRGSIVLKDLIFTKKLDKATPKLMELCAKGQVVPKLVLDIVTNSKVYYKVTLGNARINSITTSSICDPDCKLMDDVFISYSQITWEYWDSAGNKVVATYNAKTGN
jgi:type VI secretion system secreted protein Hcp